MVSVSNFILERGKSVGRALREKQIPFWKDKCALKGTDGRSDSFPLYLFGCSADFLSQRLEFPQGRRFITMGSLERLSFEADKEFQELQCLPLRIILIPK